MINLKIGARTFKTGLAILLALTLPGILGLEDGVGLATSAVVFSMMPSVHQTFQKTSNRLVANIIGGFIAFIVSKYLGDNVAMIAIASASLIAILHQLKLDDTIGLSVITLISVMLAEGSTISLIVFERVSATLIGVLIAFFVNTFILPPKYDVRFYNKTVSMTDNSTKYIRAMLRKNSQFAIMAEDLKSLENNADQIQQYYDYMRDPFYKRIFSPKFYSSLRFLVVCRQSIKVSQLLCNLAVTLHESENTINHLPVDFRTLIRERMETLMTAHEQILLKWNGRVLPEEVNFISYRSDLRQSFLDAFYDQASTEEAMEYEFSMGTDLLQIMTLIFEYDKELQRFNKLTNSFVKYKRYDQIKLQYK